VFTIPSPLCPEAPQPELHQAQRLLDAVGPPFCFQAFDDRGRHRALAQTLHGTLAELAPRLTQLNRRGAGISFTVNAVAPGKPRKIEYVTRVRALFADADDPARLPEIAAAIALFGLAPSLTVETSPGKRHFYWLCDNCPLENFTGVQKALAAKLGTDPAVCDLPRVMRLPGFYHMKREPFLVRLVTP